MTKNRTVRIPKPLVDSIEEIIENYEQLGYKNHREFIIETIRERVEKLIEMDKEKEK